MGLVHFLSCWSLQIKTKWFRAFSTFVVVERVNIVCRLLKNNHIFSYLFILSIQKTSNSFSLSFLSLQIARLIYFERLKTCKTHMGFVCFLNFCSCLQQIEVMCFGHFVDGKINQIQDFWDILAERLKISCRLLKNSLIYSCMCCLFSYVIYKFGIFWYNFFIFSNIFTYFVYFVSCEYFIYSCICCLFFYI